MRASLITKLMPVARKGLVALSISKNAARKAGSARPPRGNAPRAYAPPPANEPLTQLAN